MVRLLKGKGWVLVERGSGSSMLKINFPKVSTLNATPVGRERQRKQTARQCAPSKN